MEKDTLFDALIEHNISRREFLKFCSAMAAALGLSASYVLFLGYLVSILTGFALMSQSHTGSFWYVVGGWLLPYFPVQYVRLVHHTMMWFLIVFPIIHMYVGWMTDIVEENCVMSSIFSGRKTCREE